MNRKTALCCLVAVWCWWTYPPQAHAQSDGKILPDKLSYDTKKKDGWFPDLNGSFNFSFAQSDGVVGVQDGTTLSLGLQLNGALTYAKNTHEWRSTLQIVHTQTKLPTVESFIKSADKFDLESTYTYRLPKVTWFGFFLSLRLETPLLPGSLIRSANATLQIKEPTETVYKSYATKPTLAAQESLQLTSAFAPLLFKQSLGFDFLPYDKEFFRINLKVGAGAVEGFTQGGLRIDEDKDNIVKLGRLQDFLQIGAEARLILNGRLFKKLLTYSLSTGFMVPFFSSINQDKPIPDLINFDLAFKLGLQVFKWLAVNYSLNVVRAPLIVPDKFQITNNLVVSLTWDIL